MKVFGFLGIESLAIIVVCLLLLLIGVIVERQRKVQKNVTRVFFRKKCRSEQSFMRLIVGI